MPSVMTVRSKKRTGSRYSCGATPNHFGQVGSKRRFLKVAVEHVFMGMMTSRQGFSVMGVSLVSKSGQTAQPGQLGLKVFHGR